MAIGMIFRYFSWGFLLQRQLVKDSSASLSPSRRGSQKSGYLSFEGGYLISYLPTLLDTFEKNISFEENLFRPDCELIRFFSQLFLGPPAMASKAICDILSVAPFWAGLLSAEIVGGVGFHWCSPWDASPPHLKGRTFTSAGVGGSEGPGWKLWSCDVFFFCDVKTQHPKQVQNLNLLRILKVVGALKRKRQKDAILCEVQSISISLTLPACWAMLGLALCCFPSQTETCNKKGDKDMISGIFWITSHEVSLTKIGCQIFLFLFHALWPDSRLPCFQAHAGIKCRLGPAWHSDSFAKNGRSTVQPKKLWVDPTGGNFSSKLTDSKL